MTETPSGPIDPGEEGRWVSVAEAARIHGLSHPGMRNRINTCKARSRKSPTTGFNEVWIPAGTPEGQRVRSDGGDAGRVAMDALRHQLQVKDSQIERLMGLLETALGRPG